MDDIITRLQKLHEEVKAESVDSDNPKLPDSTSPESTPGESDTSGDWRNGPGWKDWTDFVEKPPKYSS